MNISNPALQSQKLRENLQNKMGAVIIRLVLSSCLLLLLSLRLVDFPKRYMIFIIDLNILLYSDSFTRTEFCLPF